MADNKPEFGTGQAVPGTPYRVISRIGQGGMGSVYEVEHAELGKRFVLKALLRDLINRDDLVQRLRNEWRALGQLEHPSIVSVTDAGVSANGVPYYVMERLLGETLGSRLRHGAAFHLPEALRVAAEVLDGLRAAHEIGVVHRDVKPPNIFLMQSGQAKLLDFGIAKLLDRDADLTGRGVAIGTPRYMSPEQASGDAIDGRADLYAVGLVLFEMLAGQSPFEGARNSEVFFAHLSKPPPLLSSLIGGIPAEVDRFVAKLLSKRPEDRPQSAGGAAAALRSMIRSYDTQPLQDTLAGAMSGVLTPALSPIPDLQTTREHPPPRLVYPKRTERVYSTTVSESGPTGEGYGSTATEASPNAPRIPTLRTPPVPSAMATASQPSSVGPSRQVRTERVQLSDHLLPPQSEFTQAPPTRTAAPLPLSPLPASPAQAYSVPPASPSSADSPQPRRSLLIAGMSAFTIGMIAVAWYFWFREGKIDEERVATSAAGPASEATSEAIVPAPASPLAEGQPAANAVSDNSSQDIRSRAPVTDVPGPAVAASARGLKAPSATSRAHSGRTAPPQNAQETPRSASNPAENPGVLVGVPGWTPLPKRSEKSKSSAVPRPKPANPPKSDPVARPEPKLPGSGLPGL